VNIPEVEQLVLGHLRQHPNEFFSPSSMVETFATQCTPSEIKLAMMGLVLDGLAQMNDGWEIGAKESCPTHQ
jgi:hypothetical protein